MSQALYRKYRSKSLSELVGQDHIVRALRSSIESGKISHAYLFTGPRGTGKTSVARILAHDLNGIAYDETATNLDIIEIDAASNRRIDEIRDLREKVHIAPTSLKYKVYIIDEVHMLTKEAFNALLKTLEEPPEHVIFVLATTELHKVPDTIISRTQRYTFRPKEKSKIVEHLKSIAHQENINVEDSALEIIANHAEGGFRDAIGLLDQVRHTTEKITPNSVMDALGMPAREAIEKLWKCIISNDISASTELKSLYASGYHAPQIAKALLQMAIDSSRVDLARKLLAVGSSYDPKVELQLITLIPSNAEISTVRAADKTAETESKPPAKPIEAAETIVTVEPLVATTTPVAEPVESVKTDITTEHTENDDGKWEQILDSIKVAGHSVYGPLRLAKASLSQGKLKLELAFPFHIKRINEKSNLDILHSTVLDITGEDHEIIVERSVPEKSIPEEKVVKTAPAKLAESISPDPNSDSDASLMTDPLSMVKNVFGGAEVL